MIIIIIIIDMISDFAMKRQYATCWELINENHNIYDFNINWQNIRTHSYFLSIGIVLATFVCIWDE